VLLGRCLCVSFSIMLVCSSSVEFQANFILKIFGTITNKKGSFTCDTYETLGRLG